MTGSASRREEGSALLIGIMIVALLSVVGVSFLAVSLLERRISGNQLRSSRAFNTAEAGIEHALADLAGQNLNTLLSSGTPLLSGVAIGGGDYTVEIENNLSAIGTVPADGGGATNDTDGYVVLTSTGSFGPARRSIRILARRPPAPLFEFGVVGINEILMSGDAEVLGTAASNGNMAFSGVQPAIDGDAEAGGTITSPAVYVTGTATQGAPARTYADVPCPSAPWGPAPTGGGVTFDGATGALTISGSSDITWPGGRYYFSDVTKTGSGNNVVALGDVVQIYVSGRLQVSAGGWVNPSGDPKDLQIWGCGSSNTDDWNVFDASDAAMTYYAPYHRVILTGSGNRTGAIVGESFENLGPGDVIFDSSVTQPDNFRLVPRTWTEIVP